MIWFTLFTGTLVFSQLSVATPFKRWHDFAEKHAWAEIPKGWELYGPAPADHMLNMRIGLKQDKLDELISSLYEVSDPAHERYASLFDLRKVKSLTVPSTSRYGAHLSKEEVEALVSPHPTSLSLVESWLADHGIDTSTAKHSGASSWLTIDIPVSQAERMLNTKYHTFFNALTSSYVVRTLEYSLPRELHDHIDVVLPTTYFGSVNKMKKTSFLMPHTPPALARSEDEVASGNVSSSCASNITPMCLRSLYNSSTYVPKATCNNSLGIVGYDEQYASNADLQVNGCFGCVSFVSVLICAQLDIL
jgi:tripeptidyl-peptidase-1